MKTWELICHHTYAGVPMLIPDLSPSSRSHGIGTGLKPSDFLANGASPGSGSLSFSRANSYVRIRSSESWSPLVGLKATVTFRHAPRPGSSLFTLVDSDAFQFQLRDDWVVAWFRSDPSSYLEISTALDAVGPQRYQAPYGQWTTLTFVHDGLSTVQIFANGQLVAQQAGPLNPVASLGSNGVFIGANSSGDFWLNGQLDDLKIWRLDPRRKDRQFLNRPLDPDDAECWREFIEKVRQALQADPACARQIGSSLEEALQRAYRSILAKGPETSDRFLHTAREYQQRWSSGNLDDPALGRLLTDLVAWLRLAGVSPESDPTIEALAKSKCVQQMISQLPSLQCDPQVDRLLAMIGSALGSGRPSSESVRNREV
jgi:hypothetical protein